MSRNPPRARALPGTAPRRPRRTRRRGPLVACYPAPAGRKRDTPAPTGVPPESRCSARAGWQQAQPPPSYTGRAPHCNRKGVRRVRPLRVRRPAPPQPPGAVRDGAPHRPAPAQGGRRRRPPPRLAGGLRRRTGAQLARPRPGLRRVRPAARRGPGLLLTHGAAPAGCPGRRRGPVRGGSDGPAGPGARVRVRPPLPRTGRTRRTGGVTRDALCGAG